MNWRNACAVVIPCLNEARTIGALVREVRTYLPTVFVVDDGSRDETPALARREGARLVCLDQTLGKGAALRAGVAAAIEQDFSWVITMDGDGQHRPTDIPNLLDCAKTTGAPLIVGNRMHQARFMPWLRRFVNRWMSQRLSTQAGRPLPDTQCGFRLIQLDAWRRLALSTNHFEIESEMLLAFVRAGFAVEFIAIQVIPAGPQSHINPVRDAWRWLRWLRNAQSCPKTHACDTPPSQPRLHRTPPPM